MELKLEKSFFWLHTQRCLTGTLHFTQCLNFPTTLPRLTSIYFFSFLKDRCNLTAFFVGNSQVRLNKKPLLKTVITSLASNKLQSALHAVFTSVFYPLISVASNKCPDSAILTGKKTYCTTFKFCASSRSGYYVYMEAASCHRLNPIHSNIK